MQRNSDIVPDFISAHAPSGWDMVAWYHGIGNATALKTLSLGYRFHAVGNTYAELVIQRATTFVLACYGEYATHTTESMEEQGRKVFIVCHNFSKLPPTTETFIENAKHAHLQACTWTHALNGDPPVLLPSPIDGYIIRLPKLYLQ